MPDIDKAKKRPDKASPEQLTRYCNAYAELATAVRQQVVAEAKLKQIYNELLLECDVPVGQGIDVHGDGMIKDKADCEKPLMVN